MRRTRAPPLAVVAALATAAALLEPAAGLINSFTARSTRDKTIFVEDAFGFKAGGRLNLTVDLTDLEDAPDPNSRFYLVMYTEKQFEQYTQEEQQSADSVCRLPSAFRYEFQDTINIEDRRIEYRDLYRFAVVNCDEVDVKVKAKYTFLNPGGEHLSLEDIPAIAANSVLLSVYCILALVWVIHLHRHANTTVPLRFVLSVALVVKILELVTAIVYLSVLSKNGKTDIGLLSSRAVLVVFSETLFLAILLLTAMGWTITRDALTPREKQMIIGSFTFFVLFDLLRVLCVGPSVCSPYVLSFHVIQFLITFGIIVAMNANIERLRAATYDQSWLRAQTELFLKLKMFQTFRWAFLAYLVIPIVLLFIDFAVLSWEQQWMSDLLRELLFLFVYIMIGYTFRPREANPFFHLDGADDDDDDVPEELIPFPSPQDEYLPPEIPADGDGAPPPLPVDDPDAVGNNANDDAPADSPLPALAAQSSVGSIRPDQFLQNQDDDDAQGLDDGIDGSLGGSPARIHTEDASVGSGPDTPLPNQVPAGGLTPAAAESSRRSSARSFGSSRPSSARSGTNTATGTGAYASSTEATPTTSLIPPPPPGL